MALRDPDNTRHKIVEVAASAFYEKGYKGTSLSDILTSASISKGALYHHFSSKQELLYVVFDEVYKQMFLQRWQNILLSEDPIEAIANVVEDISKQSSEYELCNGCPVHNIAAELASQDETIRTRVEKLYLDIQLIIAQGIERSKSLGLVSETHDSEQIALFFMCSLNGIPQMVKSCQDMNVFVKLTKALADYIRSIKVV
jgi:AcrR family transcriptional regulator